MPQLSSARGCEKREMKGTEWEKEIGRKIQLVIVDITAAPALYVVGQLYSLSL